MNGKNHDRRENLLKDDEEDEILLQNRIRSTTWDLRQQTRKEGNGVVWIDSLLVKKETQRIL